MQDSVEDERPVDFSTPYVRRTLPADRPDSGRAKGVTISLWIAATVLWIAALAGVSDTVHLGSVTDPPRMAAYNHSQTLLLEHRILWLFLVPGIALALTVFATRWPKWEPGSWRRRSVIAFSAFASAASVFISSAWILIGQVRFVF